MKTKFFTAIIVTVLAMSLAACGAGATPTIAPAAPTDAPATETLEQSVTVNDQPVSAGVLTINEVVVAKPSWVVIHPNENGSAGRGSIGRIALPAGRYENVEIALNLARVTPVLYAEIHDDLGLSGQFEAFDRPANPHVIVSFQVTLP